METTSRDKFQTMNGELSRPGKVSEIRNYTRADLFHGESIEIGTGMGYSKRSQFTTENIIYKRFFEYRAGKELFHE